MRTSTMILLGWALLGCGTAKEEGNPACLYEPVQLDDADTRADDFEQTPREILTPALGRLKGQLASRQVALTLEPQYDQLEALYDTGGNTAECPPNLRIGVRPEISLTDSAGESKTAVGSGSLELRFGELLASVFFDTDGRDGLGAVAAEESKKSLKSARLEGWLSDLDEPSVASDWRWSISEDCADSQGCASVRELEWGDATLSKD